ncbi:ferredoxin reductase [Georgenia yuyongxinii]|uniref:Oxidoreductase n=1 Tax=Georgenia yuyongxinii TaxID=2589797 RepID=A0A552WUC1_9MICO|nr:ferredoxin reductase [Georgenia yuyongxinii]TRW46306.1 oxidoreductase [Georgenia yuyongxinii]
MAPAAVRRRLTWQRAEVVQVARESARATRLTLAPPDWPGHVPGQHLDVRLTAEDGYAAQRSYSIASPPRPAYVELVVERLPDGEVSLYLTEVLVPGDLLELRGPIGGYFVQPDGGAPVQLIAGGSGVVPFLSMLGHHRAGDGDVRLLYSARTDVDLIGRAELAQADGAVHVTLTRGAPAGWSGLTGRVDAAMLAAVTVPPARDPRVLVCGPTGFVEAVARELVGLGHPPEQIRTERFGSTGGT